MFKHILESASDVDWMAIIPLIIFFTFFTMITVRAFIEKKEFIHKMASLPLDDDTIQNQKQINHEE